MMAGLCDVVCQDERESIWPMQLNAVTGVMWYVRMIRHEVVCHLEQNARMAW